MWTTDCPFLNWGDFSSLSFPLSPLSEDTHSSLVSPSPPSADEYCSIEGVSSHNSQVAVSLADTQLDPTSPALQQILPSELDVVVLPPVPQTPLPPPALPVPLSCASDTIADTIEVLRRRGPGRPSGTGRKKHLSEKTVRKRLHNASASKSRARFSAALEKLWDQVPEREKLTTTDPSRSLSRAEKAEIVLKYMKELQKKLGPERMSK